MSKGVGGQQLIKVKLALWLANYLAHKCRALGGTIQDLSIDIAKCRYVTYKKSYKGLSEHGGYGNSEQ